MTNLPLIHSFTQVLFDDTKTPLVICDIDYTFMQCNLEFQEIRDFLSKHDCSDQLDYNAFQYMETLYSAGCVKQTDPVGFQAMLATISQLGGKFIFLTARHQLIHEKTMNDLSRAGLENPQQFEIHYTNNQITKGDYLNQLGIVSQFDHVSFIDDNTDFLESVHTIFPHIHCYQFAPLLF